MLSVLRAQDEECCLLFSINFGIPNINPMDTTAIRIIGFFKKLNGETVAR
jgi:hypothetical protein